MMSANDIRTGLGLLQDDPDHEQAWMDLRSALQLASENPASDLGMSAEDALRLLGSARRAHEMRREYDAVARLLEMEVVLAKGTAREADLLAELARVLDDELLDDERAVLAYERHLKLRPGDARAEEALEKSDARRSKWSELVQRYLDEAYKADGAFRSALLVSAAETAYRYGRPQLSAGKPERVAELVDQILAQLKEALQVDPKNRRAALLLERVYREQEKWVELAGALESLATEASVKEEKIAGFVRLARVFNKKMRSPERAAAAYERVIDLSPGHPEATSFLVDYFTERGMWDHLVSLYDEQLATARGQDPGTILQIAMVHWKMRSDAEAAEPYFERLRRIEPAHPGMLAFFREWKDKHAAASRLMTVLTDAQRAMPDGPDRARIGAEIAKLAEDGANATKAIEQWRAILRTDPGNKDAREALKRLYRQTGGWNALADLLRSELERVPSEDPWGRLPILREIAAVYRENIKSDSALVTVLSQIIALDRDNTEAVRELCRVYETLGRWRDLLQTQMRLAELEKDAGVKAELYRAVARRWLDQFANVQNAVEAYESLHQVDRKDREAITRLKELYNKRRAYKPLYDLLGREAEDLEGEKRREVWAEMARIAAERLERGADAQRLYKQILEEDPTSAAALDALEKQAEKDKDWKTVAEVLERRVAAAESSGAGADATKLAVLQKLGSVYADRLLDHVGATRTWTRVLELSPGHAKALRVLRDSYLAVGDYDGLEALYAKHQDWEGLVEVLSAAADKANEALLKIELSYRVAHVFEEKLQQPERAFRAYERVLAVRPDDERAAAKLVPIYEQEEKWGRLPALYEVLLGHITKDFESRSASGEALDEVLGLLKKLAKVTGDHLGDRASALGYVRRAYELAPNTEGLLAMFEGASAAAGDWGSIVEALKARSTAKKVKREERHVLRAKLAHILASELGDVDQAVEAYRALIEENEDDTDSVVALDRLLRSTDRRDDLRWLFDVRISRSDTAQKVDLLSEWAILEEEAFSAPEKAIELHRRILELVPQHGGSLRAISRLLKSSGDAAAAALFLEKDRDQREGAERAGREIELARMYMGPLRRVTDALAAAKRALELTPNDRQAIAVVEDLLHVAETRAQAASILEKAYGETGQHQKRAEILEVLIATAAAKVDRIALYVRLCDVLQHALGTPGAAFDVMARATSEFPMELDLWDRLGVLANKTHRSQAFVDAIARAVPPEGDTGLPPAVEADLSERAATLYDEMLGEIDHALPYLNRILARDPGNDRAFARLKQILTTRERWSDLEAAYERAIEAADEVARKCELLSEVALVAEEITGERPKAIAFYERMLELSPMHEIPVRALDVLYGAANRWDKLAGLLARRLANVGPEEATALKLRLGAIHYDRLGDPKTALAYVEDVLQADANNRDARDLVERCLNVPELRSRAAMTLEQVYAQRDEPRDLVRVLEVRLEFYPASGDSGSVNDLIERRELLRRIAELRDERLTDDPGAFEAYLRLLPLVPADVDARERMLEIARRLGRYERAAEVLSETALVADAPQPRAEILGSVAKIYEEQLKDGARAEAAYRKVLDLDPDEPALALPAARALERVYAQSGKNAELAEILKIQVKLEEDAGTRRALFGRLGDLCEVALDDPRAAQQAWKQRLEEDPGDEKALAALDRLYERTQEWRALVEVLRARERSAVDAPAKKAFLLRTADILADKLTDVDEAILAYRAAVDDFGADRQTLAALERLYEVADRWQDLAETLSAELDLAFEPKERLALLSRLGVVRKDKLKDVHGAIDAHRQALTMDPSHGTSRDALEALLADADVRREVAATLRPLYEAEGDQTRLLRVLDIEAEYAESTGEKLATIARAATVAEGPLSDLPRAFGYVARGLKEAVGEPDFRTWLERAERLAGSTGRWPDLIDLLVAIVPDIRDAQLQLDVLVEIAEKAASQLGDKDRAKTFYVKALELEADDRRALVALEALYGEANDASALLGILKRRADAASSTEEKRAILFKKARLCDETLHDRRGAIDTYEEILDIAEAGVTTNLDPDAVLALERLYGQEERYEDLIRLYERQLETGRLGPQATLELHHKLGVTYETKLKDIERAFDEYEAALALHPASGGAPGGEAYEPTVEALERVLEDNTYAARAAEMLEPVYMARLDWRKVMRALRVRLESSEEPDERRTLIRRLVKLHEEQEENYSAALDMTAMLFAEDLTDETTWHELERLARVANAERRLADIFAGELEKHTSDEPATARLARRTGELYEAQGNDDRALVFYRRAHAFAPDEDKASFHAIDRLLRKARRSADRVALYRAALDYREDPVARLATLHTIAEIQETELRDETSAIETYRAALEVEESEPRTLEALTRLYTRRERWRDLADLLRRRAEQAALVDDEAKYRLELGNVLRERLSDATAAIDEFQNVVELVPPGVSGRGVAAVKALEGLLPFGEHKARIVEILRPIYEKTDDWRHLISVDAERLALATTVDDRVAILRETAKLWEERGKDATRAFEAITRAFVLDPDDGVTRGELDRLAEVTKKWDRLSQAYEQGIAKSDDVGKKELLGALARLHDKKRDDPRRALEAYDRLFAMDETNPEPLEEMDPLATLLSDWPVLVRVLTQRVELTSEDAERANFWRRVGECKRDMLEDAPGAIDAYEHALELESGLAGASPAMAVTIDKLIALYEAKNDAPRLVDLYRRRIELCGESEQALKFELLVNAANRYEIGLSDRREAIALLGEALQMKPREADVLKKLDVLYTEEKMWPELLENLRLQVQVAADGIEAPEARRVATGALKKRIGHLLAYELDEPRQALESYKEVLAVEFDEEAAKAIRDLGESRDELRIEAAEALEPVLRKASLWSEVASVLELRLRAQSEAPERGATLRALSLVAETQLGDAKRAQEALLRALAEEPAAKDLHAEIERLCDRVGQSGWSRYADVLGERAAAVFDVAITTDLHVRLGRIAEEKLGDDARAAKAYAQAVEQAGDDVSVLSALDRLYGKLGETRQLADVIERRVALETQAHVQADLYHRLAALQIREFGENAQGLATLRLALEKVPDHARSREALGELLEGPLFDDAFEALEVVYRALGKSEELAGLYERRVARATTVRDRARARLDLARVLEEVIKDPARAQRVIEAQVAEDASDLEVLAELERLAAMPRGGDAGSNGWREACVVLLGALEAVDTAPRNVSSGTLPTGTRSELWVRVATWQKDKLHDLRAAEDAYCRALAVDSEAADVLRAIEELQRAPGRERDLVATLRGRAKLESSLDEKRKMLEEAKVLAETIVQDRELAEAVLRDLLAEDEANAWALEELTKLREAAGDHAGVVKLLLQRADLADGEQAVALKHAAAKVLSDKLEATTRAIDIYEQILEQEPGDAEAAARLRALYAAAGRERELGKLLALLIDNARSPGERTALRLDLARLQDERFGVPRDAVDTLRAILDEEPSHADAVVFLSQLYEKTGQDEELAELLSSQIARAKDRGEADAELAFQVRLGEVYEGRLKDTTRALETYESVLARDDAHPAALQAVARLAEGRAAWERAAVALLKLLKTSAGAEGVALAVRLAAAREKLGDTLGVEDALRRALEIDPKDQEVRARLRDLYEKGKKWSDLADLLVGDAKLVLAEHPEIVPVEEPVSVPPSGASMPPPAGPVADVVKLLRRAAEIHMKERGEPSDAVPLLERASALLPHDRELLLLLVDAYTAAKRERDAAQVLERVIASYGNRRVKELSVYHHRLGKALAQLGDKDVALTQLDMAFKIDPGSISVLRDLGVLAFEANDLDRAQKTFKALLLQGQRLDSNAGISKGEVFYYLGEISAKQGDKVKAVQMLERAIENEPGLDRAKAKLTELKG